MFADDASISVVCFITVNNPQICSTGIYNESNIGVISGLLK